MSTTEAKYVALSTAMRDVIYLMNLIDEMKSFGITLPGVPTPKTTCRVFEDNVGALELANTPNTIGTVGRITGNTGKRGRRSID